MKKNKRYSINCLKQLIVVLVISLLPIGVLAQNEDSHKAFINRTGLAVLEAQKAVNAAHKTNVDGKLAKLVQQQMRAVVLFNKKEYALASYTSSLAREEAIQLITKFKGEANSIYTVSDESKNLFADKQMEGSRENIPTFSEKDQDYLGSNKIAIDKVQIQ